MSIDYVIDSGTFTWLEYLETISLGMLLLMILCSLFGAVFGTAFSMLPVAFSEDVDDSYNIFAIGAFLFFSVLLFCCFVNMEAEQASPEGWREAVAQPYYESLPLITKNIEIISVTGTTEPEVFEIVFAEKNLNGSLANETVMARITKESGRTSVSYEYKEIIKDIPNFKEQGRYEEIVRVPNDFVFFQK